MAIVLLFLLSAMTSAVLVSLGYRLVPLLSRRSTLAFSPNSLRIGEVFVAIVAMVVKSIIYSLTKTSGPTPAGLYLRSPLVITAENVVRFRSAVGYRGSTNTLHLKHGDLMLFLSAMTEPAMLLLLASPWCPINPLGAVNVRNTFELIRPDLCDLEKLTKIESAYLSAVVHPEPTRVRRGIEWALEVTINVPSDKDNRAAQTIFRQTFTMLEFKKTSGILSSNGLGGSKDNVSVPGPTDDSPQISFSRDDPLEWAALCKDYNFIHLSGFAAKLSGLPGKLLHGNHAAAKALRSLSDAGSITTLDDTPLQMRVEFKKPMVVPGIFQVCVRKSHSTGIGFEILRKGRVHAICEYGPLELDNA
jgi:hypothetical protein